MASETRGTEVARHSVAGKPSHVFDREAERGEVVLTGLADLSAPERG